MEIPGEEFRTGVFSNGRRRSRVNWKLTVIAIATVTGFSAWAVYSQGRVTPAHTTYGTAGSTFQPTITNRAPPPGDAPENMAWIPGGEFSMGADDPPDMNEAGMKATEEISVSRQLVLFAPQSAEPLWQ
jgi:formylglycine-generating enzyme